MTDAPKPKIVFATIIPPSQLYPAGQVAEGCYLIIDGMVTLTARDGKVVKDHEGKTYRHKLQPGENPDLMAILLTKRLRRALQGKKGDVVGFNRRLPYFNMGKI